MNLILSSIKENLIKKGNLNPWDFVWLPDYFFPLLKTIKQLIHLCFLLKKRKLTVEIVPKTKMKIFSAREINQKLWKNSFCLGTIKASL